MTPKSQRIAIAEASGWSDIETLVDGFEKRRWEFYTEEPNGYPDESYKVGELVGRYNPKASLDLLPNYLTDLNAMHEAEKIRIKERDLHIWQIWYGNLANIVHSKKQYLQAYHWPAAGYLIARATATQRAEALLRTLSLWNDTK